MDSKLEEYLKDIADRTGLSFPHFADEAVHTAPVLAVLLTPGNSGAEKSGVCSLDNDDPTAKRTERLMSAAGIVREQVIFWNFYAAYEKADRNREFWVSEMESLVSLLPNLRVLIAFGNEAWQGIRDVRLPARVRLIGAPHPSNRSCNPNPRAEGLIADAWQRTKSILDENP